MWVAVIIRLWLLACFGLIYPVSMAGYPPPDCLLIIPLIYPRCTCSLNLQFFPPALIRFHPPLTACSGLSSAASVIGSPLVSCGVVGTSKDAAESGCKLVSALLATCDEVGAVGFTLSAATGDVALMSSEK